MPTPEETQRALTLVTGAAVSDASSLVTGTPDQARSRLLDGVPQIVSYYSDGSAALAADHYDDLRDAASPATRYRAQPLVLLREEKIDTGIKWAIEPLFRAERDDALTISRIGEVVQYETAGPFRYTITTNTARDPSAVGWQRNSNDGCKFCRMLAGRGAVYKATTARFASHPNCDCTASPVFDHDAGPEASVMQYVASKRTRTPQQRQALREYLAALPD